MTDSVTPPPRQRLPYLALCGAASAGYGKGPEATPNNFRWGKHLSLLTTAQAEAAIHAEPGEVAAVEWADERERRVRRWVCSPAAHARTTGLWLQFVRTDPTQDWRIVE